MVLPRNFLYSFPLKFPLLITFLNNLIIIIPILFIPQRTIPLLLQLILTRRIKSLAHFLIPIHKPATRLIKRIFAISLALDRALLAARWLFINNLEIILRIFCSPCNLLVEVIFLVVVGVFWIFRVLGLWGHRVVFCCFFFCAVYWSWVICW